ncbi:MAG: tetratricopeptide repeat protein [Deltaproteobacteria bacterium]|nr:tetratricopeptide repeat protein [Deltaproteobacteria bacterium]
MQNIIENQPPTLIERDQELSELIKQFLRVREGNGSVLFIAGEAGAGKTALLEEFLHRIREQYHDVISGSGECNAQVGIADAYLPFKELLWNLVGSQQNLAKPVGNAKTVSMLVIKCLYEVAPDIIACFVPFAGIGLKGIQVILGQLGIKPKSSDGPSTLIEQNKVFEQYFRVLTSLSQNSPTVVIIEDLQWSDEASIALLFYLGRRISKQRILIIGSYRPHEISLGRDGHEHSLLRVINELRRHGSHILSLDRVRGKPDDEIRIDRFIQHYLDTRFPGHIFPESFISILNHRTAGNPLFLKELLENMYELGEIAEVDEHWQLNKDIKYPGHLPERVEAVIQQRVGRLTEDLKRLLTTASVEGEDFTAQVLAKLQDLEEDKILEKLVDGLGRIHQLVDEKGEKIIEKDVILSFFHFRYRLIQEHLYRTIGESQRRLMHRKVAECLESLYGDNIEAISAQLARHFELAYIYKKAYHYWNITASQAGKTFATHEAIRSYQHAIELWSKAFPKLEDAKVEDRREKLIILRELGDLFEYRGDGKEAEKCHQEALSIAKSIKDDREEMLALDNLADVHLMREEYDTALEYYKLVDKLAVEKGYEDILCEIYCDLADLYDAVWGRQLAGTLTKDWSVESRNAAERYCQLAIELCGKKDFFDQLMRAYRRLSMIFRRQGDIDNALLWAKKSLEVAESHALDRHPLNTLGELYRFRGELDVAWTYYSKFREWAEQSGSPKKMVIALNNLGIVCSDRKDYSQAHRYFDESLFLNEDVQYLSCLIETHIMKGITLIREGKRVDGINEFRKALSKTGVLDPYGTEEGILKKVSQELLSRGEIQKSEECLKSIGNLL